MMLFIYGHMTGQVTPLYVMSVEHPEFSFSVCTFFYFVAVKCRAATNDYFDS